MDGGKEVVKEPSIIIEKNILRYEKEVIQLCNISRTNVAPIPKYKYNRYVICVFLSSFVGLFIPEAGMYSFIPMLITGGILYLTYYINKRLGIYLSIEMNSGKWIYFSCDSEEFLLDAQDAMVKSFNGSREVIEMNFKNCQISNVTGTDNSTNNTIKGNNNSGIVLGGNNNSLIGNGNDKVDLSGSKVSDEDIGFLIRKINEEVENLDNQDEAQLLLEIKKLLVRMDGKMLSRKLKDNWSTIVSGGISNVLGSCAIKILEKLMGR